MAIAKMAHLRLIGLRSQQNKIVDVLASRGLFEARTADVGAGEAKFDEELCNRLRLKQSRISFALDFIRARHEAMSGMLADNSKAVKRGTCDYVLDYDLPKVKFSSGRMLITHADFSDARAKEYDLLAVCDDLQKLSFDIIDCRTRLNYIAKTVEAYAPYAAFPMKLSATKSAGNIRISLYYGKVPAADEALKSLPCAFERFPSDGNLYAVVCTAVHFVETDKALGALGYTRCTLADDCTAAEKISALEAERADVDRSIYNITKTALGYEKYYNELRILYDVTELEIERVEADAKFKKTDSAFVLEGWIPEKYARDISDDVVAACPDVFLQLLAAEEHEEPPTLVVSNKVVEPYESITNMYSPPKYSEIDPNPIMAIFFFLFFGIMIGDAAYGLILAAVGLALGCGKKCDKGMRQLLLLVGMGGISAVIWGVLFGSYFAIDFGEASSKITLWFNPLEEPMTMLILSIVLGVIQLCVGYIIKFVRLCMERKPLDAIFDAGSIILLFAALACLGAGLVIPNAPKGLSTAAIVLACTGLALIVIFGGRKNKNVFGKIFGGLKGLYGLVNLFSDILSYCRLFGLGLASCAIGLAFNTLGGIIFQIPGIGYPLGIIILIPLHAFNIGLGILGAYVHNARLQFLEFYGKFYDGGGRLFEPLGLRTKHTRFA